VSESIISRNHVRSSAGRLSDSALCVRSACGRRILHVVPAEASPAPGALPFPHETAADALRLAGWAATLDVCDDPSDTWSHSWASAFGGKQLGRFEFPGGWETVEAGPIRAAVSACGRFGHSRAWVRAMAFSGSPALHIRLSVVWAEVQRLLRLRLAAPAKLDRRIDLVSGGPLVRAIDAEEYPLNGAIVVGAGATACPQPVAPNQRQARNTPCRQAVAPGTSMAAIAPEVFSVSADAQGVSLTLLRSPYVAHHDPYPAANRPDHPLTDQGLHEFDIILSPGAALDLAEPARLVRQMLMPPVTWDLTG
jgi:alpha-mannosidase